MLNGLYKDCPVDATFFSRFASNFLRSLTFFAFQTDAERYKEIVDLLRFMSLTTTYKSCNFIFPLPADYQKTDEQREREMELIEQLVSVVNKRDQLVQFEDSQLQQ